MSFALIKAAKAVSPQRLHDADVNVGIVVLHELFALKLDETGKHVEIMFEQLLAQLRRQIRFGVVQKRSDIVLQRTLAASLIIQEAARVRCNTMSLLFCTTSYCSAPLRPP